MRLVALLPLVLVLAVPDAAAAACVSKEVDVGGPSRIEARLDGTRGDWDLTVHAGGREIAGGASPDAHEVASGYVKNGRVTATGCGPGTATLVVAREPVALTTEAPRLVTVDTPTRADKARLLALGLDLSEHGGPRSVGVVLHDAADQAALRGFTYHAVTAAPRTAAVANLPSGRTSYRTLADYERELKALAAENPSLVRLFVLPNRTFEGREVLGIEIAEDVAAQDGRPAFLNMGVHHAREWPAGELTMEWAYELIDGYKAGEERATNIVRHSRNLVVPIVNPDGFNGSRSAALGDDGRDETLPDEVYIATSPGEYRRKNCRVGSTTTAFCPLSIGLAENGVDVNRNYAQFWGGPGSDTNPLTQTYRGPAPFSEPESRNIQWLVSHNQVTTLITNHTTAGLVLRAPGLAAVGDPVDEGRGYKALGDAMAAQNGYFSQKGYELYDTTGTTEDWSYNATGGYGFTFELYCGAPNYETGDCDAPSFHPRYATMAAEWDGTSAQARHVGGKGNREAYYLAAESTIDEARHSIIEGSAPAGTTLTLTKDFKTAAFDPSTTVDDHLETTLVVGPSGTFRWHVNPSTRPIVEKAGGSEAYTLSCGAATTPVTVARGGTVRVDPC
ncbi:M14 family zinc carboxypeptidase [Solirubrobacter soli]|uniref:M14 family zinc carboxypeptidase n=1 Tax=Solirubrobacter soli TaxID=363832 RepID=UPI000404BE0F|nr:M14 family zinc carboxypeptidase [Solirubrobacter soli]